MGRGSRQGALTLQRKVNIVNAFGLWIRLRTLAAFGLWIAFPDERTLLVPASVSVIYLVTVVAILIDMRHIAGGSMTDE
jgi:hypothetical protein